MTELYFGFRKLPKGKQFGTLQQAVGAQQVRYWGKEDYLAERMKKLDIMRQIELKKIKDMHPVEQRIHYKFIDKIVDENKKVGRDLIATRKFKEKANKEYNDKLNQVKEKAFKRFEDGHYDVPNFIKNLSKK